MFLLIILTSIIILIFLIYTNYETFKSSNKLSKTEQKLLDKSNNIIRYKDVKALRAENYLEIVELLNKKKTSKKTHKPDDIYGYWLEDINGDIIYYKLDHTTKKFKKIKKIELSDLLKSKVETRKKKLSESNKHKVNYPLFKEELSMLDIDKILSEISKNNKYKGGDKLNLKKKNIEEYKNIKSLEHLINWFLETLSEKTADLEDTKDILKNVNRSKYLMKDKFLISYKIDEKVQIEVFEFQIRIYREHKRHHFVLFIKGIVDYANSFYYIDKIIITGLQNNENIHFYDYKKNIGNMINNNGIHFSMIDNKIDNPDIQKQKIDKFLETNKKQIYNQDRGYCFYKEAKDKIQCISPSHQDPSTGIWDEPCLYDEDCPFFNMNTNYPNKRGGCFDGYCEMPTNLKTLGYKKYISGTKKKKFKALCYNCKKKNTPNCKGMECNMCCDDQKNKKLYPELHSPDYVFPNDFNERIKYSDIFNSKNISPIRLIA
jgi:hypothetical protein